MGATFGCHWRSLPLPPLDRHGFSEASRLKHELVIVETPCGGEWRNPSLRSCASAVGNCSSDDFGFLEDAVSKSHPDGCALVYCLSLNAAGRYWLTGMSARRVEYFGCGPSAGSGYRITGQMDRLPKHKMCHRKRESPASKKAGLRKNWRAMLIQVRVDWTFNVPNLQFRAGALSR